MKEQWLGYWPLVIVLCLVSIPLRGLHKVRWEGAVLGGAIWLPRAHIGISVWYLTELGVGERLSEPIHHVSQLWAYEAGRTWWWAVRAGG